MSAGPHHDFNDAISLTVACDDQAELDRYWNALLEPLLLSVQLAGQPGPACPPLDRQLTANRDFLASCGLESLTAG